MPSERVIIVGTRGSRLALRQTELVLAELSRRFPDRRFRVQEVRTTGDRRPEASLAAIGGQGVFVKELEAALRAAFACGSPAVVDARVDPRGYAAILRVLRG